MTGGTWLLSQTRITYQWLRFEQLNQWWHWLLLVAVALVVCVHVVGWYRRDGVDLARPVAWSMLLLRLAAFLGILLYFFQLEKRAEQRMVRNSRIAILLDTSLSMTAAGTPSSSGIPVDLTRAEETAKLLSESPLLDQLSAGHDVSVYRFDSSERPSALGSLNKREISAQSIDGQFTNGQSPDGWPLSVLRSVAAIASFLAAVSLLMIGSSLIVQLVTGKNWTTGGWFLLSGSAMMLAALVVAALAVIPHTQYPLRSFWNPAAATATASEEQAEDFSQRGVKEPLADGLPTSMNEWLAAIAPSGTETRLGDAIKFILDREISNPLAGIVLVTDGRSNSGIDPRSTIPIAQNARVPFFIIGVGSERRPANVQLVELDAPRRLYPGDSFSVSALISSTSFPGKIATIQFLSGRKDDPLDRMVLETETTVELQDDGSMVAASVELPPKSVGSWSYVARILPLPGESDESDNLIRTDVEVVERQNRVLIVAGGPMREYQFVRNMLYRDQDVQSHVFLQSGGPATAQEAQRLIDEFPADRAALAEYDAVLAFDVDWTRIPEKAVLALEKWVAEQAGGLLIVAGPVETPKWLSRAASGLRSTTLRDLSPVILDVRGSALLAAGRVEGESSWPLTITADGRQTEFLWLTDQPQSSLELWQSFSGVHTYYSAYELKPGAKALALFSDPSAAASGQQPIYLASQFYGAGRVVFQAGGEMWRLRSLGDQYFDRYYTKLVRWISQGRLLMDSDRGVLLVDREEAVQGEQVSVRAVLKTETFEPLLQTEVVARLISPQGLNSPMVLRPLADGSQPGVYSGQFPVLTPGTYRIQLQLGGLTSDQFLRAQVQARVPRMEMQNTQRHDTLLSQMALETGGLYWRGCDQAVATDDSGNLILAASIPEQDQVVYSPGTPDREFQLRWLGWLMIWIAASLAVEWLSRRVHRLA
jgi:hypothetical protein